jgi:predicted RNA-binding Zn-ribbon protein involved in translation (DUF1610 family)
MEQSQQDQQMGSGVSPQQYSMSDKKYCIECASEMKLDSKGAWFCPNCGYRLEAQQNEASSKKGKARKVWSIVKILLLAAAGICALFIVKYFFATLDALKNLW